MRGSLSLRTAGALSVLIFAGCGGKGSAKLTGDIGTYTFNLKTIFGWIDEKELKEDQGKRAFVLRDEPRLVLRFSGASFDPETDMRLLSPNELQDLQQAEAVNGMISLTLSKYHMVTTGQQVLTSGDGPRLNVDYGFAIKELKGDAEFPGDVPVYGSKFSARLTLTEAGKKAGEAVAGTLDLVVESEGGDPAGARTGQMSIEFDAPLIHERIAECNMGQSRTDWTCEPEYPRD